MRQVILDIETTGLDFNQGHRIIEIGVLELIDRRLTGELFRCYINPERKVESDALVVHGITDKFLSDKPTFPEIAEDFFNFVNGSEIVIHNAPFDVGFIEHEFKLMKRPFGKLVDSCKVFDTLVLARKLHPGQRNSLDALCKRYHVDNSNRELHGALLDAELLAQVYLAMTGGQRSLFDDGSNQFAKVRNSVCKKSLDYRATVVIKANENELSDHEKFINIIKTRIQNKD